MKLHLETGGRGHRVCILLHGLGANAEVWRPLARHLEHGGVWRWIAPDQSFMLGVGAPWITFRPTEDGAPEAVIVGAIETPLRLLVSPRGLQEIEPTRGGLRRSETS